MQAQRGNIKSQSLMASFGEIYQQEGVRGLWRVSHMPTSACDRVPLSLPIITYIRGNPSETILDAVKVLMAAVRSLEVCTPSSVKLDFN